MFNEDLVIKIKNNVDVTENMTILWNNNKRFVYKIANHFLGQAEEDDLMQEGYLGLYDAVYKYDPDKGVLFLSYAEHWIRQRMYRFVTQKNSIVRIPDGRRWQIRRYMKAVSDFEKCMGRKPKNVEIANIMGISAQDISGLKSDAKYLNVSSLDISVNDEDDATVGDLIVGSEGIETDVVERENDKALKTVLWSMVDSLEGIQPKSMHLIYENGKTRKEVADTLDVTEWEVRREEGKALKILRHPKRSNILRMYIHDYMPGRFANVSISQFNNTWTSQVERDAFKSFAVLESGRKIRI